MEDKIKVSVIIPSYKPASYLCECLNSVMHQTLTLNEFEVLIILNGPKEPFYSWIQKMISPYPNFKLLYNGKCGVSNARNLGIQTAIGEFICFIDDDDLVSPSYLERLLEKATVDTISMSNVYSFKKNFNERRENFFICKHLKDKDKYENASFFISRSFLAFPVAKLIHRNIIGTHRFNSHFRNGEDALFITSITDSFSRLRFATDDAIYYVRERSGSASRKRISVYKIIYTTILLMITYFVTYLKHPLKYSFKLFVARIPGVIKNAYLLSKNT
ncbi:glycosyltransferase family 2 protein [Bacteroides sp. GD17]|jgi:glycosyltransferase involved in cell wall biosynthesis|uniref:glycosyltransferase family 2 protein n=1 Tax=Bacteroides sp. GD17 TaxID=3139826 RepID=UPI0025FDA0E1|nr:glycosyltransferase family 2 protein [uncultured Bacteroides sp.]